MMMVGRTLTRAVKERVALARRLRLRASCTPFMHAVLALASLAQWRTVTVYDVLPESCRFSISNNDVGK
eukprot:5699334-Prymnesium_polylepis.2